MKTSEECHGYRWCGRTHPGRFRPRNEDSFLALNGDAEQVFFLGKDGESSLSQNDLIFAVSDGMGGHEGGNFASRMVVDKITRLMPKAFRLAIRGMARAEADFLVELFDQIHRDLVYNGRFYEECRDMGATLSMVWITPERVFFAHIGDSRIYRLPREGGLIQITEDHTHVGWLVRTGKMTPLEARMHPAKNQLQKALGGKCKDVDPQIGTIDLFPGDRLLLCTDGILDGVGDRVIESVIREPSPRLKDLPVAERIIKEAMEGSSRDNLTAVVVERL